MATKTDTWDETTPPGTEDRRRGDNRIRDLKRDVRQRMGEEHEFTSTSGTGEIEGRHLEGSARAHRVTTSDADPTLVAAYSEGRMLIKDAMDTQTQNGLYHGDGSTSWQRTPVGIANMTESLQFGSMVRDIVVLNSVTTEADFPGTYRALEIDTSTTFYDYTPKASGNTLLVFFQSTFVGGTNTWMTSAIRFDTTNVDEAVVNGGMGRASTGADIGGIFLSLGIVTVSFIGQYTIPSTSDVKVEVVARSALGSWNFMATPDKRTIIIEVGTN
jgi:hypothetical protein